MELWQQVLLSASITAVVTFAILYVINRRTP